MKIRLFILMLMALVMTAKAQQTLDDCGRIILNTYLPTDLPMPLEARRALETKLNQITTTYGMGGSQMNPRFIITASITVGTKDIIAGPPQKVALNLELTLFVGDAIENKKYAYTAIALQGVGDNENKALIDAIKTINIKRKEINEFVESGKSKIVSYYSTQCDFILKQANSLASQYKFEEAIYELMLVPEVCKECFTKIKDEALVIFNKKVESDCQEKLKEAKLIWSAEPNESGAATVVSILSAVIPSDHCKAEINKLSEEIKRKLESEEKKQFEMNMLERKNQFEMEQNRLAAIREIALERAKNQPKAVTNNYINW
jgi:hypothetical protein